MNRETLTQLLCDELARNMASQGVPRIPAGGLLLWRWFVDIAATRTWHAAGPNPIGYVEIEAYARAQRLPLRPDHFATLRAMDEVYVRAIAARQRDKASGVKTLPPKAPGTMTAGMFDAMFG